MQKFQIPHTADEEMETLYRESRNPALPALAPYDKNIPALMPVIQKDDSVMNTHRIMQDNMAEQLNRKKQSIIEPIKESLNIIMWNIHLRMRTYLLIGRIGEYYTLENTEKYIERTISEIYSYKSIRTLCTAVCDRYRVLEISTANSIKDIYRRIIQKYIIRLDSQSAEYLSALIVQREKISENLNMNLEKDLNKMNYTLKNLEV